VEHLNQGGVVVMVLAVPEVAARQVLHRDRVVILWRIGLKGEFWRRRHCQGDRLGETWKEARGDQLRQGSSSPIGIGPLVVTFCDHLAAAKDLGKRRVRLVLATWIGC
jgi:hypothetical protein